MNRNRKLTRLHGYDYSSDGYYFGDIENNIMALNEYGRIACAQWEWLSHRYPYVTLNEYIIMPNHIHGIIRIVGNDRDHFPACDVGNGRDRSLQYQQKIKPLSELIGAFKTTTSKLIHYTGCTEFTWQKSFHDHIIRNQHSLTRIRRYIVNNPGNWLFDSEWICEGNNGGAFTI
jgi:putative transposase